MGEGVEVGDAGGGVAGEPVKVRDAGGEVGEVVVEAHEVTKEVILPPARVSAASFPNMLRREILCSPSRRPRGLASCEKEG